ncbi:DNA polymerase III subunit delta [Xylanibacillus composti]|uniref:DNA polymerase III subunit delta n=1 Tax=Xylanibacillus composti TaxID=1572762 RepID=A0A8J4H575_9BACL|nr:DNA polymerase III subunit delta [Xylanibacillus composti]MDT9724459.1 DNA polymerase III subunit delta [Xylanibacillus composti]GIQ69721.1 hypothetical protein XYCOK13_25450 [Xylanibacillus composti]
MSDRTVWRQMTKGQLKPVYVCYGSEGYLMEEFLRQLTAQVVEPGTEELAVSKYDCSETPLAHVLEDAETLPFMAARKLVVAVNAVFLTGSKDKSKVDHDVERLHQYLEAPSETTVLLFTVHENKLDERKKIVKKLKQLDGMVPCTSLTPGELAVWIERRLEKLGCRIEGEALETVAASGGNNLQLLAGELDKLAALAGRNSTVTQEMVLAIMTRTVEQNIFQMVDDIVNNRMDKAFAMLDELLKQKEEPIKIASLIARQYRIIAQVKELSRRGYSQQQIASSIGVHPYAVKVAVGQSRHYEDRRLANILQWLGELDYDMKTGRVEKQLGLDMFLLQLAAGSRASG